MRRAQRGRRDLRRRAPHDRHPRSRAAHIRRLLRRPEHRAARDRLHPRCPVRDLPRAGRELRGREICFNAYETAVGIADVTDKQNPKPISVATYPNVAYAHQGWLSEDQRYCYLDDEGDELAGPVKTRAPSSGTSPTWRPAGGEGVSGATAGVDHNLYVKGNQRLSVELRAGAPDPRHLRAEPARGRVLRHRAVRRTTAGFAGAWSNYPFFKSGTIIVRAARRGCSS